MATANQYNLRRTVRVPVNLQGDSQFLEELLVGEASKTNMGISDDSVSSLDCSALVNNSDSEPEIDSAQACKYAEKHAPSTSGVNNITHEGNTGNTMNNTGSESGLHVQSTINAEILKQLQALENRLDAMEKSNGKKTNDASKVKGKSRKKSSTRLPETLSATGLPEIPDLHQLRQTQSIQKQVQERLKEIQEANVTGSVTKNKSLRGGPVDIVVPHRIKWPHEYVLAGSTKERISYDQLSTVQWVTGFCRIMREEKNEKSKDCMLDYLIALLEDAQDFSWYAAKASHAVLLCRMEQGEIENFQQVEKIDRVRRANAQRHVSNYFEFGTNMFVRLVSMLQANLSHIRKRNVGTKNKTGQKTCNGGHAQACPKI